MPTSRGSSPLGDQTHIRLSPALVGRFFTSSATWEAPEATCLGVEAAEPVKEIHMPSDFNKTGNQFRHFNRQINLLEIEVTYEDYVHWQKALHRHSHLLFGDTTLRSQRKMNDLGNVSWCGICPRNSTKCPTEEQVITYINSVVAEQNRMRFPWALRFQIVSQRVTSVIAIFCHI